MPGSFIAILKISGFEGSIGLRHLKPEKVCSLNLVKGCPLKSTFFTHIYKAQRRLWASH